MKTIAVFNQSGGVGKTTLTFNLGYHLAKLKKKVLLIDIDPQASLTTFCGAEPSELESTIYETIMDADQPLNLIDIHGMKLAPSNINLAVAEQELITDGMRDVRLKEAIAPIADQFDIILIDCPPSLGVLSILALVTAQEVLVPIQTEYKSLMGTSLLLDTFTRIRKRSNRKLAIAGFVPTLYSEGVVQHDRGLASIREQLSPVAKVFDPIPRRIDFANSAELHQPLELYKAKHPAIKPLKAIAKHLANG